MALLAFAAVRRAAGRLAAAAVDQYFLPAANPPTLLQLANWTDKRTDTVPLHIRCPAVYCASSVKHVHCFSDKRTFYTSD